MHLFSHFVLQIPKMSAIIKSVSGNCSKVLCNMTGLLDSKIMKYTVYIQIRLYFTLLLPLQCSINRFCFYCFQSYPCHMRLRLTILNKCIYKHNLELEGLNSSLVLILLRVFTQLISYIFCCKEWTRKCVMQLSLREYQHDNRFLTPLHCIILIRQ